MTASRHVTWLINMIENLNNLAFYVLECHCERYGFVIQCFHDGMVRPLGSTSMGPDGYCWTGRWSDTIDEVYPDSKVHEAYVGPTWGRQDPGGPHVGPMNLVIREVTIHVSSNAVDYLRLIWRSSTSIWKLPVYELQMSYSYKYSAYKGTCVLCSLDASAHAKLGGRTFPEATNASCRYFVLIIIFVPFNQPRCFPILFHVFSTKQFWRRVVSSTTLWNCLPWHVIMNAAIRLRFWSKLSWQSSSLSYRLPFCWSIPR